MIVEDKSSDCVDERAPNSSVSWRTLLRGGMAAAFASPFLQREAEAENAIGRKPNNPRDLVALRLRVNRDDYRLPPDTRTTLLDALREHIALTGSKEGCDQGAGTNAAVTNAVYHATGKRIRNLPIRIEGFFA